MISSQKIVTGFFFHTLKLLQNDLSSKVHTKVLQIRRNHPIITGSYEHKLLTVLFLFQSHCIMISIPMSVQESYI